MSNSDWKEATVSSNQAWDRKEPLEGEYVKFQQNVGPNESMMYTLKKADGEEVGVWGSTTLDSKFVDIPLHSKVRIEPLGLIKSEKTGRSYLDFRVLFKEPEFKEAGTEKLVDDPEPEMPADFLQ